MLLNKGSYGSVRFFTEYAFAKMLPISLGHIASGIDLEWGIGLTWHHEHGLSKQAFGHGAASGAVLRIDPKHELVIVSCRNRPGHFHPEYMRRIISACVAPF